MSTGVDLLGQLREFLITQAIVRKPAVAGAVPPLFIEPSLGAPAPGEKSGTENNAEAMLSIFLTGGIPPNGFESFHRYDTVDVWLRTAKAEKAFTLEDQLRKAVIDKRDWQMGALRVIESSMWRPLQRLGSDTQGYTFIVSFLFELYS